LDRLALSLGGNTLMPLVTRILPGHMQSSDWKQRHAALICLAQIAEGCVKAMLGHLDGLVGMCLQVRWTALIKCHVANASLKLLWCEDGSAGFSSRSQMAGNWKKNSQLSR
jgi:HEAT repeat